MACLLPKNGYMRPTCQLSGSPVITSRAHTRGSLVKIPRSSVGHANFRALVPSKSVGSHSRSLHLNVAKATKGELEAAAAEGRLGARWEDLCVELRQWLSEGKLKSISPVDAEARWQEEGGQWMFVDVQTEEDFGKVHCIGTINIPLFTPIAGNSFVQMQRKAAFALYGNLNGTEENPELVEDFEYQMDNDKSRPVMLVCGIGGSLQETDKERFGVRSRSLIVAHRLLTAGFEQVYWVEGGVRAWFRQQLPTTLTHEEVF